MLHGALVALRGGVEGQRAANALIEALQHLEAAQQEQWINTPLMLWLVLTLSLQGKPIPHSRAELFESFTQALADSVKTLRINGDVYLQFVQYVAFKLQGAGPTALDEVDEMQIYELLKADPVLATPAQSIVKHIKQRGGLLELREGIFRFPSRSIHEFQIFDGLRKCF